MNNLLYNARMALRDIMEVNIFTRGNDRVYVTVSPELVWEGALPQTGEQDGAARHDKTILHVVDRLGDMDLELAGGADGITALKDSEPVEILRRAS